MSDDEETERPEPPVADATDTDERVAADFWDTSPAPADSSADDAIGVDEELPEPTSTIAGFWRRVLAFVIDMIPFAAAGVILGLFFFDQLANLGPWGRLIGFTLTLAYFGILDSRVGHGQTLGKRLMRVRVVDRNGELIGVPKAMARYAVLAAPSYLNQLMLPVSAIQGPITYILSIILFGLGGASIYLFIFNRRTRQSTHDLAVGSFVTSAESHGAVEGSIGRVHLVVVGVWLALSTVAIFASGLLAAKLPSGLFRAVEAVQATGEVHTASIFIGKNWDSSGEVTEYVAVNAFLRRPTSDPTATAEELALLVLKEFPEAHDVDVLDVKLTRGYDLGFASAWKYTGEYRSPEEWQEETRE